MLKKTLIFTYVKKNISRSVFQSILAIYCIGEGVLSFKNLCPIPLVSNNKICSSQITCNITSIKLTETPISIPRFKCSGDQQRHTRPSDHQDPRSKQFTMVTSSTSQTNLIKSEILYLSLSSSLSLDS